MWRSRRRRKVSSSAHGPLARVEHDDGAHRGRLALRGGEPALGELREVRRIRDGDDDVVLLDDLLVEAVGLLARQIERGLEDRLLA
jgi:hypothetical protein